MLKFTSFNEEFDVEKIRKFVKPTVRKTVKDTLNPVVWDKMKMRPEIRERLLAIAEDFHESLELDVPLENVVLVGSMANFNWHRHSDFDLHLIVDFKKINDDVKLVEELLDLSKKRWNELHHIYIKGYPVEVAYQSVEDYKDLGIRSAGKYSITHDKWESQPKHISIPAGNEEKSIRIANRIAKQVEDLLYDYTTGTMDVYEVYQAAKAIWAKIKTLRSGLAKFGEYDAKNLAFKKLRNDGYLEKVTKLKANAYDKIFSLDLHPELS